MTSRHGLVVFAVAVALTATACDPSTPLLATSPPTTQTSSSATPLPLTAQALSSFSVRLTWETPRGTSLIQVLRDGRLIDRITPSATTFTDYLTWEHTSYAYEVVFLDSGHDALDDQVTHVTTLPRTDPFPYLYASSSFWNSPVPGNVTVEPNSASIVRDSLVRFASSANLVNTSAHGYPIAYADPASTVFDVGCTQYDCATPASFPVPAYAQPSTSSDHHLTVLYPTTGQELDMFGAKCCWTASSRYISQADGWGAVCPEGQHCNGAVAAGFAALGGIIRPEEILQGHIDHALSLATPYTRAAYIACPATHTDGKYSASAIPEGARIQLDPSFNVTAQHWPRWQKVVARALQVYGAYVADTSGSLAIRAESDVTRGYDAWALAGVSDAGLTNLPWSRMRVLQLYPC